MKLPINTLGVPLFTVLVPLVLSITSHAATESVGPYLVDKANLCNGYPTVSLGTENGNCIGLVATENDGLRRPRRIIQRKGDFFITDMVGWAPNAGIVWKYSPGDGSLSKVFSKVDHAHGLGMDREGYIYVGTRSEIFRFIPEAPLVSREVVVNDLPIEGSHPLTHFIFDNEDNLIVNVGAPSDQCLTESGKPQFPCPASKGETPEASIRKYIKASGYQNFETLGKGLRNSMALAIEPTTGEIYQAENNMDFKDADSPKEEINHITKGKHYGWPYCYEKGLLNSKYKRSLFNRSVPKIDCDDYEAPVALLPAHSAPLDMLFYDGEMFPEFRGELIVSLHGYRDTGHRIIKLSLNNNFVPAEETKEELVYNWAAREGVNPRGAPVGMTVAEDGSIWFVEDKNKTIMVMAKGDAFQGDTNSQDNTVITLNAAQEDAFNEINKSIFRQSCVGCHGQFEGNPNEVVNTLKKEGFILPGNGEGSPLYIRMSPKSGGNRMPIGGPYFGDDDLNKVKEFIDALM